MSTSQIPVRTRTDPGTEEDRGSGRLPTGLLFSLAMLSAFAPISMDMYLPAFPQIMADLQASSSQVQWTMTTFLAGACLGQFVFGPLSDRFGRRGPLLVGSALAVVASCVAALSPSIGVLIATRLLQGVTGAAGMVIGRAVVADRARGREAARGFTLVMVVNGVVPVIAPFVGSLVLTVSNWRVVLGTVAVVAAATMVAVVLQVPESLPPQRRSGRARPREPVIGGGMGSPQFLAHTTCFVFAFATLMAYISTSSFLYQEVMGWSALQYGLLFGGNALVLTAMSTLSTRRIRVVEPSHVLDRGLALLLVGTLSFMVVALTGVDPRWLLVPLVVAVGSLGLVLGNSTGIALAAVPHSTGRASAILGGAQFGLAAVVSWVLGLTAHDDALPLALVMVATSVIAAGSRAVGSARARRVWADPTAVPPPQGSGRGQLHIHDREGTPT